MSAKEFNTFLKPVFLTNVVQELESACKQVQSSNFEGGSVKPHISHEPEKGLYSVIFQVIGSTSDKYSKIPVARVLYTTNHSQLHFKTEPVEDDGLLNLLDISGMNSVVASIADKYKL